MGNVNKNWSYRKTDSHIPQYLIDIGFIESQKEKFGRKLLLVYRVVWLLVEAHAG